VSWEVYRAGILMLLTHGHTGPSSMFSNKSVINTSDL